jgi:hypothetical protein
MGISNVSNGFRPGVCTSTTRPTAPFEGQMIYETDTNRVLVYDSAAWVMIADTDTPPGLEHIKTQTFSASTAVNVDSVFSSTYDNYVIELNVTGASASTGVYMRMRTGGTTNANSNYALAGFNSYAGSNILNAANSGGATTDWYLGDHNTANYSATSFRVEVMQPFLSYRTCIFSSGFIPVDPLPYYRHVGGAMSVTTSYDGFALVPNSASFNITGTVRVYGYRN